MKIKKITQKPISVTTTLSAMLKLIVNIKFDHFAAQYTVPYIQIYNQENISSHIPIDYTLLETQTIGTHFSAHYNVSTFRSTKEFWLYFYLGHFSLQRQKHMDPIFLLNVLFSTVIFTIKDKTDHLPVRCTFH